MSALPSTTTFDEYLNEQLINCLNLQTNVIQNLAQYSQHLSLQLFEIKNNVNILANRILILEEQQSYIPIYPPPPINPLLFFQHSPRSQVELPTDPIPFSFSTNEQPSRAAPFVFGPLSSNHVTHLDDEEDEDDEPSISFVQLSSGEEDENILFCERAKLYRFDVSTNQLKERGIGEMKILEHRITHQCRVLMRREQVFKVCANHKITSQLELKPHPGIANAYIWSVVDFTDGEGKHETFCVKFKIDEQAKQFARIFNQSKGITGDLLSIGRISLNDDDDDDVIPIGEVKPTHEQIERARKLQLPLTFYLYENKPPCKGCRGCREESSLNEIQLSNQINSNFPSGFFPNSTLPSLMSMMSMWSPDGIDSLSSPPKDYRMIIKAKRSLPSNRMPPPPPPPPSEQPSSEINRGNDARVSQMNQKKSRNFSGHNLETYSVDNYASKMVENILDQAKNELSKQIQIVTSEEINSKSSSSSSYSGFSFTNFQLLPNPIFSFGNTPELSFADLVKQSSDETETNTTDDSYEPTISYKPIVQLSPVELKTGEEDENILFCERAKLYRFDVSTNQMKERGIGEMKILEHKITHHYRILMRREQVLKICANHKITSQLELKPHQTSANTYVWSAIDFSDGNAKHETLCVKFKTSDIAKRFFQQFNDAKIVK